MDAATEDLIASLEALLAAADDGAPRPPSEPLEDWALRHGLARGEGPGA